MGIESGQLALEFMAGVGLELGTSCLIAQPLGHSATLPLCLYGAFLDWDLCWKRRGNATFWVSSLILLICEILI